MAAYIMDDSLGPIGGYIHSNMTLAQFQAQHGPGWVLADGTAAPAGSAYAAKLGTTVVPNAMGAVLRAKDNGAGRNPDGDLDLGTYQADGIVSHGHTITTGSLRGFFSQGTEQGGRAIDGNGSNADYVGRSIAVPATGGAETRMKNVTANIFIRIN